MNKLKRSLPTLEDVAQAAGVSTATVSRCLNEPQKVSKATKETVMKAVEDLRYTPNFGARAIAANRTGIFGAVIPTMENSIFARGIEAFQKVMVENGKTMIVASSAYDPKQEANLIRTMVSRGADGILLIGTERDPGIYDFLNDRNIPYVIAWALSSEPQHSYVGFDNHQASRKLVSKALELGHQTFGYISAKLSSNDRARERVLGALGAIKDHGFDPNELRLIETNYSIEEGEMAFRTLSENLPSLVICGNDVLAAGAIRAALSLGLEVPKDVSIVGFDDIDLARVIQPNLTTVHVPHRDMGRQAGETLLKLLDTPEVPIKITLETKIVEAGSLGPAP